MSDSNRRHTPSLGVISTIFGCVLLICFANSVSREDSRSFSIKKNSLERALWRFLRAAPYFIQPYASDLKLGIAIMQILKLLNCCQPCVRYCRAEVVLWGCYAILRGAVIEIF